MSVLIKGMDIPENCTRCDYIGLNVAIGCPVMSGTNGRATDCPLIALPDHHGRLVDADKCEDYFWEHLDDNGMAGDMNAINDMPTIVEAEDSKCVKS